MTREKSALRLALAAALALPLMIAPRANAGSIVKCMTIKKPGFYTLTRNLTSKGGDCLIVIAPNVTLWLGAKNVTGAGAGIGLHVTSSATGFRCHGDDSLLSNFAIGVQDDADGAVIESEGAENNTDTGVFVNGAKNVTLGQNGANNNGKYGYHLLAASHTMIHNFSANSNGTYGVYIDGSDHTELDQFVAGDGGANGLAGVFIGCSRGGPGGICDSGPSNFKYVSHGSQQNNKWGLVVDGGSGNNVLADTLEANNVNFDVFDSNANCGTNLWFFDAFKTSNNPGCMNQQ